MVLKLHFVIFVKVITINRLASFGKKLNHPHHLLGDGAIRDGAIRDGFSVAKCHPFVCAFVVLFSMQIWGKTPI